MGDIMSVYGIFMGIYGYLWVSMDSWVSLGVYECLYA